jgi:preprotein translocase subunit YajC
MFLHLQQLASVLIAQAPASGPQGGASGCADNMFLMPVIMMAILYVVWILPARKEKKQHEQMLENLKRGDEIITTSGILGTVTDIIDKVITIEIAKNVKIRVLRSAIAKSVKDPKADQKSDDKSKKESTSAPDVSKETKPSKT